MKHSTSYVLFTLLAYAALFLAGMGVGLSKGVKECKQIMLINESPCFPVGEEGWHYINCDCCKGYVWHNPNEEQKININIKKDEKCLKGISSLE